MRLIRFKGLASRPLTEAAPEPELVELAERVQRQAFRRLGRSLAIRAVDAGSCNGCELEMHALSNAYYDLERFGFHFVASPRHADLLMVTGPMTRNMRAAVLKTWEATPDPKWVVAIGDCAFDGGCFAGSPAVMDGVASVLPVDLVIHGCPPPPAEILKGLLGLMEGANAAPSGVQPPQ